ncbi:MAG: hypothetical protein H6605_04215 [Flavobacteriales bacterium]|nr:hypothetical protein [Flavobacteriales bacterium]
MNFVVNAQVKYTTSTKHIVSINQFGIKNGLNHRSVTAIYKDSRGIIWVATRFGISRFDGFVFKNFELPQIWELPISQIVEDNEGYLWLSNLNGKNIILFQPKQKKWKSIETLNFPVKTGLKSSEIHITRTEDRKICLVQTQTKNVFFYEGNGKWEKVTAPVLIDKAYCKYGRFFTDPENCLYQFKNGKMFRDKEPKKWRGSDINYIPTPMGEIMHRPFSDTIFYTPKGRETRIITGNSEKYLYSDKFIFEFFLEQEKLGIPNLSEKDIASFYKLTYSLIPELRNNYIREFIIEKDRFFFINNFGLFVINIHKSKFNIHAKFFGDSISSVKLFAARGMQIKDNFILVNQEETGLHCINLKTNGVKKIYPPDLNVSGNFAVIKLKNGNFYAQTAGKNLILSPDFKIIKILDASPIIAFSAYEFEDNKLLLGPNHYSSTLHILDLNKDELKIFEEKEHTNLNYTVVNHIGVNRDGQIVLCTRNGIFFMERNLKTLDEWNNKSPASILLPTQNINSFYHDEDGSYWLATGDKGLLHVFPRTKIIEVFNIKTGFPDNTINMITDDHLGNLWISCDNGLVCMQKSSGKTLNYTEKDGISNDEFNRGSFCEDKNGNLFFGSLNGITSFNLSDFKFNMQGSTQEVQILGLQILRGDNRDLIDLSEEYFETEKAIIRQNDKYCIIDISILDYNNNRDITYAYRIEGLDKNWTYQKTTSIKLGKLPYGSYILSVKALVPANGWTKIKEIKLEVLTPFYLSSWFVIGLIIVLLFLVYLVIKYRTANLIKERVRLAGLIEDKTKTINDQSNELRISLNQKDILLKEIHHRVKNNLQVINSLLEMQNLRLESENAKIALKEGQLRIMSIALIHEQLFQGDNLAYISLREFAKNLFNKIYMVFNSQKKPIQFMMTGPDLNMEMESAVPLGLILNELLTNSFKHAFDEENEHSIHLEFISQDGQKGLIYSDSGPGLDDETDLENSKSMGLLLIRSLSKQINGKAIYNRTGKSYQILFGEVVEKVNV